MGEKEPIWVQALSAQVKAEARATAAEAENARLREALRKIDQMSGNHEAWGHVARAVLQGNQVERFSRWLQNAGYDGGVNRMSDDLPQQLLGRAAFLRDRGEIKSPELLEEAAAEIRSLREQVARARIEGAEIMREHVVVDLKSYGLDVAEVFRGYNPAAILDARARAKAMDDLIAGDADLIDGGHSTSTR